MSGWIWMSDVTEPPTTQPGDDIEVMWHGGTTARGNLHYAVRWPLVVAYKLHGKIPRSSLDEIYGLVWEKRPGINKVDRSYVDAFGRAA